MGSEEAQFREIAVRGTAILAVRHKELGRLGAVDSLVALARREPEQPIMMLVMKALLNLSCDPENQVRAGVTASLVTASLVTASLVMDRLAQESRSLNPSVSSLHVVSCNK